MTGKVLQFPKADEMMTCYVRFPNISNILGSTSHIPTGMENVALAIQSVSETFDDLAVLFEDCPGSTYSRGTHFVDGHLVFEFQVPRRYRAYVLEMGFEPLEDSE